MDITISMVAMFLIFGLKLRYFKAADLIEMRHETN